MFDKHMELIELLLKKHLEIWFKPKGVDYVDPREADMESSDDEDDGDEEYLNWVKDPTIEESPELKRLNTRNATVK